ncbi:MAG: phage tail tape measure protein [Prevotellaceae bacterium]|jgi:TP901 family phage tail tape measure protein|nr:phage tail tape measure protein [Prevotellaceae bacterium]
MADNKRNFRYNIYINGDDAIETLANLERSTVSVEKAQMRLRSEGKVGTQEWKNNEAVISDNIQKMKKLAAQIDVNSLSVKELRTHIRSLNAQKNIINPNYKAQLAAIDKDIAKFQGRLNELTKKNSRDGIFSRMAGGFNKFGPIVASVVASITGVSLAFRKLAEDIAKMDDVYSDVMKTTGMTHRQVEDLNEEFKKMDTRTSREELNLLARDAGKLGLTSKKDILDFVEAGNQIRVALGEDMGEDAIKNIGKLVNVMENSSKELQGLDLKGKMLSIGSAVNALGQASTASEPYLVAFSGRLGGMAKQAGISASAILGFASSLDQDMQSVEMSATALQKFTMDMFVDPAKYAKLAGKDVKEFTTLLKTDANEAILTVLDALNKKGGFMQLAPLFKDLGMDGARAVGVLSSLAGSIGQVREAQALASRAMTDGTSVTNEYGIKNDNLAARMDKAKKAFNETALELGASLNPILLKSTNSITYLIKALVALMKFTREHITLIKSMAWALGTYVVVQTKAFGIASKSFFIEKAKAAIRLAGIAGLKLKILFTNQATAAELGLLDAQNKLNTAIKRNLWGLIAAGIVAALVYLVKFIKKMNEASEAVKIMNNVSERTVELEKEKTEEIIKEKNNLNVLVGAIIKTNDNEKLRENLIKRLKSEYPDFLKHINDEKLTNELLQGGLMEINKQYDLKIQKLKLQAKAMAINEAIQAAYVKQLELEREIIKGGTSRQVDKLKKEYSDLEQVIENLGKKAAEVAKEIEIENQKIVESTTSEYYKNRIEQQKKLIEDGQKLIEKYAYNDDYVADMKKQVAEQQKNLDALQIMYANALKVEKAARDKAAEDAKKSAAEAAKNAAEEKENAERKRLETELKNLENNYKQKRLIIDKNENGEWKTEEEKQKLLLAAEKDYLNKRIEYLKGFKTKYTKLEAEAAGKLIEDQTKHREVNKKLLDLELSDIKNNFQKQLNEQKINLTQRTISEEEFNKIFNNLLTESLQERLDKIKEYGFDAASYEKEGQQIALDAFEQQRKAMEDALEFSKDSEQRILDRKLKNGRISQEQYDIENLKLTKKYAALRLGVETIYYESVKKLQEQGFKGAEDILVETVKKIEKLKVDLGIATDAVADGAKDTLSVLAEYFDSLNFDGAAGSLMSAFASAFKGIKALRDKDKAELYEYIQVVQSATSGMLNYVADLTKSVSEMETAQLEAEHAKQLSDLTNKYNEGVISQEDYNAQKEQLDYEQKVEELELQKQYADVNLGVQLAQTTANTALGIAGAWAQGISQLGPIAGAIVAGIATAALITTAIIQTKTAVAERNKIKAMTIEKPGGSGSEIKGARIVSEQAAEGRYDVIGADDGKTYRNVPLDASNRSGIFSKPTLVAEEPELVVSTKDFRKLQKHVDFPVVLSAINDARFNRVPQRASGDYSAIGSTEAAAGVAGTAEADSTLLRQYNANLRKNNALMEKLLHTSLRAYVVLSDLEAKQRLQAESASRASR